MKLKLTRYLPTWLVAVLSLLLVWGLSICIVDPGGNFPLNDDWAYARGVHSIVEQGQLVLDSWPAMTLIGQIGIGAAYCEFFGFSFETLRWSTLINSFLCVYFFFLLLRKIVPSSTALFTSLLLFFNPLFFSLSFTFMTEVHFLMALMASLFFFSQYVESSKYSSLLWASLFSILATLIRQPGILAPLSFGLILLFRENKTSRKTAVLLPFAITFLSLKIYYYWIGIAFPELYKVGGFQDLIDSVFVKEPVVFIKTIVNLLLYPGLFLFPLVIYLLPNLSWKKLKNKFFGLSIILFLGIFLALNLEFFPVGNVFYNLGLGPKLIKGIDFSHVNVYPKINNTLWKTLDYISLMGTIGILLLIVQHVDLKVKSLFQKMPIDSTTVTKWGIGLFCGTYLLITVLTSSLFDRYSLPLIPCIAFLILPQRIPSFKISTVFALLCLAVTALFSVTATHDYLSWNRARKVAYDYLSNEKGIPPTFIDAGFEINGWLKAGPDRFMNKTDKSWWFVTEDDYALSFEEQKGFQKWKAYSYQTFLPPKMDSLFILKKDYLHHFDYNEFPISSDLETRSSSGEHFLSTHPKIEFSNGLLQSTEKVKSGKHSIQLTSKDAYGLTTKLWGFQVGDRIVVSIWRYPAGSKAGIVLDSEYKNSFYDFNNQQLINRDSNGWEQLQSEYTIPPHLGEDRIAFYIWNNGNEEVWLDDIQINKYSPKE